MNPDPTFRCPPAARWLGLALASAVVVSAGLLSARIYPGVEGSVWSGSRALVLVVGAVLALAIVRTGGRARGRFTLSSEALVIEIGRQRRELPWEQVVSLGFDPPFVTRREWLSSMVLGDRFDRRWRIPALLDDGARFVDELVRVAGRDDLRSFADAHGLREKMARTRTRLIVGYAVSAALVLGSLWLWAGGPAP